VVDPVANNQVLEDAAERGERGSKEDEGKNE
jgi:hypothetical protein